MHVYAGYTFHLPSKKRYSLMTNENLNTDYDTYEKEYDHIQDTFRQTNDHGTKFVVFVICKLPSEKKLGGIGG